MSEQNKVLIQRWFTELWNNGNPAIIDELLAPDGKAHGFPDPSLTITHDAFLATYRDFTTTFSDIHVTLHEIIAEGDSVAVRLSAELTHTGPGLGFAPAGKRTTLSGAAMAHIRNGQIQEAWNFFDIAGMVAKLQTA